MVRERCRKTGGRLAEDWPNAAGSLADRSLVLYAAWLSIDEYEDHGVVHDRDLRGCQQRQGRRMGSRASAVFVCSVVISPRPTKPPHARSHRSHAPQKQRAALRSPMMRTAHVFDEMSAVSVGRALNDPSSRHLFCFVNERRNQIKVVYWPRTGFCLASARNIPSIRRKHSPDVIPACSLAQSECEQNARLLRR